MDAAFNVRPKFPEYLPSYGCRQRVRTSAQRVRRVGATRGIPRVRDKCRAIYAGNPRNGGHCRSAIGSAHEDISDRKARARPKSPFFGILRPRIFTIGGGNSKTDCLPDQQAPITRRSSHAVSIPTLPPLRRLIQRLTIGCSNGRRKERARIREAAQVKMKAVVKREPLSRHRTESR